jgi:integrase
MPDDEITLLEGPARTPWNKGKLIGAKPPLRPKHVWSIRTRLMVEGRTRELAMFNLAIDSKLRGCDVIALKVEDVAPNGYTIERATVRQRKTGRPVKFELTEQTRQAIEDYLRASGKKPGESIHEPPAKRPLHVDTPVRASGRRMDWQHRARSEAVRHAFIETDESDSDLPANGKPSGRAAFAWPHEDREYGPLSRHRGR